jgi:tetratricopeptide (TPR) repeat protein
MSLICHEDYPNLVFKVRVFAIEDIQEPPSDSDQEEAGPSGEVAMIKLWEEAVSASEEFECHGKMEALEQAIAGFQKIIIAIPENDSRLPRALSNLGTFLHSRFEQLGRLDDLNDGLETLQRAVNLTSDHHPDKPGHLTNLGDFLRTRFERLGDVADINDAIVQCQAAVNLTPDGHVEKPSHLNNLGVSLEVRFERLGKLADLDAAIAQKQAAVNLTPDGHSDKPRRLANLGDSLQTRFERFGNLDDLNDAITQTQAAVKLTPDDHPYKPSRLNNLGSYLQARFIRLGNLDDIDNAIIQKQAVVNLTQDGHPNKPGYLNNLANSLRTRFQHLGNLADIDNAIAQSQAAINLIPNGHPEKPGYLSNLGIFFEARFQRLGNLTDLNAAITRKQAAVKLVQDDHPSKPGYLTNLSISLETRFQRLRNLADINDAIAQSQAAVNLIPDGHPRKPRHLNGLGVSLRARFERLGNFDDLNAAIMQIKSALNITPEGHPSKPGYLNNLGISLGTRFDRFQDLADLNNALEQYQKAVDLTPETHPDKVARLYNFAAFLEIISQRLQQPHYAELAISHLSVAAKSKDGPPSIRFDAAEQWISIASRLNHASLLAAYECAVDLIPLVAWLGLPIVDRHQHLARIGGITREAVAAAISVEQHDKALEWLEQGRSIVWTQILHLRKPVDSLHKANPGLANRLVQISQLLEQGGGQGGLLEEDIESIEERGRRYRALTMEWESIIERVRALPDFKDFLRPPSSRHLMKAVKNGTFVVVNIATKRCDALAILSGRKDIRHIPLPKVMSKRVVELRDKLKNFLHSSGIRSRGTRALRDRDEADEMTCERVLAELWNNLVQPVLSSLGFSVRVSQKYASKRTDDITSSLIRTSFLAFGGAPLDRSPSCLFTQPAYTIGNP